MNVGNTAAPARRRVTRGAPGLRALRGAALLSLMCFLSFVWLAGPVRAALVASSAISYCTDDGDAPLNCSKKMVVTVTVDAGQLPGEESLVFVSSAADTTVKNATPVLFEPLRVTASRSTVRYRYPLFYVQNYNAKPTEATVKGSLLNQCNADFNAATATCGLAYDAAGVAIPYSQGFCCDCSMCQTLGLCNADARANAGCNVFDQYTTASCLRFGERWYSGYTIGGYVTWFTVNVTLSRNVTGAGSSTTTQVVVVQLSPGMTGDTAGQGWDVQARIIGNFAPSDQPLDLTSRMLFAPAVPPNDARVLAGSAEWMLLANNLVTLDGRECDKVGVSYEAFASQGNRCNLNPGSCLHSQLEDYRSTDMARLAAGKTPLYLASGYGTFSLERDAGPRSGGGSLSPYLSYLVKSPPATMLTLTVNADDLQYIVGVANAIIVSASLNKATLVASSTDGVLTVVVRNTASVTGRVEVSVQRCTAGVFPMTSQTRSLAAQQESTVTFNVYMQNSFQSGTASCTVELRNAEEVVTDSRVVSWTVKPVDPTNGTQGGSADTNGGGTTLEPSAASCAACSALNIVCATQRRCWQLILLDLLAYVLIIAAVVCVIWFRRIFCCCLYSLSTHQRNERQRRHARDGRDADTVESTQEASRRSRSGARGGSTPTKHRAKAASTSTRCAHDGKKRVEEGDSRSIELTQDSLAYASSLAPPPATMYVPTPVYYPSMAMPTPAPAPAPTPPRSFASPLRVTPPPRPALVPPLPEWGAAEEPALPPYYTPPSPRSPAASYAASMPMGRRYGDGWPENEGLAAAASALPPSRSSPYRAGSWGSPTHQQHPETHNPYY